MLRKWIVAVTVVVVLLSLSNAASAASAVSPDQTLKNAVFLGDMSETRMVFGSFAVESSELLIAYLEYDDVVDGHGAFVLRTGGAGESTRLSFIASKDLADARLGFGVHRVTGEDTIWLLDAAAAYMINEVMVWAGVYDVPVTQWGQLGELSRFAAGASMDITSMINAGLEARLGGEISLTGSVTISVNPDLKARVYAVLQESALFEGGLEGWYTRDNMLLYVGYAMDNEGGNNLRVGVGFRF